MKPVNGLLFYLSGQKDVAEYAAGRAEPSFHDQIEFVDGVTGGAIRCDGTQTLAWCAKENIYA